METRHEPMYPRTRFARHGLMWCLCAAILAWGLPARADEVGQALLKSARWRAPAPSQSRGPTALAAMSGGGPIVSVSGGAVTALDRATGKRLWSFGLNLNLLGVGQKVVLVCTSGNTSAEQRVFALSGKDGSTAYEIPLPQEYNFRLPGDVGVTGGEIVITSNRRYTMVDRAPPPGMGVSGGGPPVVTTFDLETGKQLRKETVPENAATGRAPATARGNTPSPLRTIRGEDGKWYSVEPQGEGDPATTGYQFVTRDAPNGKVLGQTHVDYAPGTPAAIVGQILIMREPRKSATERMGIDMSRTVVLTEDEKKEKLTALNLQTGKPVWTAAVTTDFPSAKIRAAGDLLLIGGIPSRAPYSPQGRWTMSVLDQATGKLLWSQRLHTDVTLYQDLMVFALVDQWVGVNRRDGKPVWSVPCDPFITVTDPSIPEGTPFSSGTTVNYAACNPLIDDGMLYLEILHFGDDAGSGIFAIPLEGNPALRKK
jgi:outer membrane protein assembly factor BamB